MGSEAVTAVKRLVPELRGELGLNAVILNGENSAPSGRGITVESGEALLTAVDFLTLGDHRVIRKTLEVSWIRSGGWSVQLTLERIYQAADGESSSPLVYV